VQVPAWQTSLLVQALLSLQATPSALGARTQAPFAGLQEPAWAQAVAGHWTAAPLQEPAWQTSLLVQLLPSEQVVPSALLVVPQAPSAGLQTPTLHGLVEGQVLALPPEQVPDWHVSVCVQALPSLQAVPFARAAYEHVPLTLLQTPAAWH
jgi:hypothetical protein